MPTVQQTIHWASPSVAEIFIIKPLPSGSVGIYDGLLKEIQKKKAGMIVRAKVDGELLKEVTTPQKWKKEAQLQLKEGYFPGNPMKMYVKQLTPEKPYEPYLD